MGLSDKLEVVAAASDAPTALTIIDKVRQQQEQVALALPAGMDAGRFIRMVLTEMKRTPKLMECTTESLLGGMMLSAQTGLEPGGPLGQAWLIPRWNGRAKVTEAQFQIGWRGYVQLAARSGVTLTARTVREDDLFEWEYGTSEFLRHRPKIDSESRPFAWYSLAHFADGRRSSFTVIDKNVAALARTMAQTDKVWSKHYDAMARKTAILRHVPFLSLSTDVQLAMKVDGAVVTDASASVEAVAEDSDLWDNPDEYEPGEEPFTDEAEV